MDTAKSYSRQEQHTVNRCALDSMAVREQHAQTDHLTFSMFSLVLFPFGWLRDNDDASVFEAKYACSGFSLPHTD